MTVEELLQCSFTHLASHAFYKKSDGPRYDLNNLGVVIKDIEGILISKGLPYYEQS